MKVEALRIINMRGLAHLELRLQPGLNLLAGENGCGKTTVLDALAYVLKREGFGLDREEDLANGTAVLDIACTVRQGDATCTHHFKRTERRRTYWRSTPVDALRPPVIYLTPYRSLFDGGTFPCSSRSSLGQRWRGAILGAVKDHLYYICKQQITCEEAEVIVLIDGLELGLHPRLQREVVHELTATFPRCQFIATTHSPIILGEVRREQIHLLTPEGVFHPRYSYGMEVSRALEEIMGTPDRPRWMKEKLARIDSLFTAEKFDQVLAAILKLAAQLELGKSDPEIMRLRTLLAFMEGDDLPDEDGDAVSQEAAP